MPPIVVSSFEQSVGSRRQEAGDELRRHPGRLAGEFLVAYAAVRAVGELFREPDAGLILGLSRGTFYSIFMVALGIWLIVRRPTPLPTAAPALDQR